MSAKIYVGNLSWNTTDDTLRQAFGQYGNVLDSIVMRDRDTGRSRGFGFVTYSSEQEAQSAIASLNEQELDGRRVKVNLANPRGGAGGGGGGGYQGGGGGYGGGYSGGGGGYQSQGGYGQQGGYGGGGYGGGQSRIEDSIVDQGTHISQVVTGEATSRDMVVPVIKLG
ncbi:RNA-binding domain-containing protein [Leucogyrophana mollusca]|uniref:RNA-binding domain-containing protein n=1 Tax=Leucogyrophana mollusca TaxID=85980 RepID=A0ACB8BLM8_9AGAM|nr:RNA-binding domain-containing protein [Leucogyrophana mollusca]